MLSPYELPFLKDEEEFAKFLVVFISRGTASLKTEVTPKR
jgi:hypothetical protein